MIQVRVSDLDMITSIDTLRPNRRYFLGQVPHNEVCSIARSINALRAVRAC